MSGPVLAICMPIARAVHPDTMRDLMKLDVPKPYHLIDVIGYPVTDARNMIADQVLAIPEVTHLMWIDDDMRFAPKDVRRLLDLDLPIVGGLCHGRRHPYPPILLYKSPHGVSYRYEYPKDLVEVDATGFAFILVKREVLEAVRAKFPDEGPFAQRGFGEDVSFCDRARECGYKIMVDTRIEIGHIAEVVIEPSYVKRNRFVEVNPWVPVATTEKGEPRASIVIPTWNQRLDFLHAAVASAFAQTAPCEIIVIDNGSSPPVDEAAIRALAPADSSHRLRFIRVEDNIGCFGALNLGIAEMTTPWFAWLSSDDVFAPRKIARQLRALESVGAHAGFHAYDVMFEHGEDNHVIMPYNWHTLAEQQRVIATGCVINGLTALIHRSVFAQVGVFDVTGDFSIVADWEFWNRVAREFMWLPIPEILATRREHASNASTVYANDPIKHARWVAEDAEVRKRYAPRCARCGEAAT
jgi:teichuronic acid biosynthesis glycosyltransferase TuaG